MPGEAEREEAGVGGTGEKRGVALLHDPLRNHGTAFTERERERLGLRGLLPPRVSTLDQQVRRVLGQLRQKASDLERYIGLVALQDRNETLFYRVLVDHLTELMPIVYTPTVGEACEKFGHIFRRSRGLYVSARDRGRVRELVANWPHDDVRMIVITDGERILGLGDLGADGMGIPIGKLALYTACAGIHPARCLPVMLDVGTDDERRLGDELYLGLPERRLRGEAYDELFEETVTALLDRFPAAVVQMEDFGTANAFGLLERYGDRVCLFNDDIQGTGAVALAGLVSSCRITGTGLRDGRYLFVGAGEAALGIADTIVAALVRLGIDEGEARRRCWLVDSKGLVVASREGLAPHKRAYAHEAEGSDDLVETVRRLRPTALLGASGVPGIFDRSVLEALAGVTERPIVFALSNPTSKSECTAEEAYRFTDGRAVFASGSPFPPVELDGRRFVPGQANNAYIFPGVGLGAVAVGATRVTGEMFVAAARALAAQVREEDLALGRVYPDLARIRDVSARVAEAVAGVARERGLAREAPAGDLADRIRACMWEPVYGES